MILLIAILLVFWLFLWSFAWVEAITNVELSLRRSVILSLPIYIVVTAGPMVWVLYVLRDLEQYHIEQEGWVAPNTFPMKGPTFWYTRSQLDKMFSEKQPPIKMTTIKI